MPTVTDENTGEEVEVRPVQAALVISTTGGFNSEFPPNAGKIIEEAMAAAMRNATAAGVTDPDELRALALKARESVKAALRQQQQ